MGKLIEMPQRRHPLPRRPKQFAAGLDIALGTHDVVTVGNVFTIARTVGGKCWYPLTQRANPDWLTWSNWSSAHAQLEGIKPPILCHQFWGQ